MGASLRPELARIVAEHYLKADGDWETARNLIQSSNALQSRSVRSSKRMETELRQRIRLLTPDQIALLAKANSDEGNSIAWLAVIKHSAFVFEFTTEVLREKLEAHDSVLRHSDYETFIDLKSASHPELVRLSSTSKIKVRQILLLMLTEAGLLKSAGSASSIQRPILAPAVLDAITSDNPRWLAGFLVPDNEIGEK